MNIFSLKFERYIIQVYFLPITFPINANIIYNVNIIESHIKHNSQLKSLLNYLYLISYSYLLGTSEELLDQVRQSSKPCSI